MKKILVLTVLTTILISGFSQIKNPYDYEKKSTASKIKFKASSETGNYDIIYHRILWEVNPAQMFIKGEVTSHFKAKMNNTSTIYFDLIDELDVDSVKQNGVDISYTHSDNLIKITLSSAIDKDIIDSVTVYYKGKPESSTGFGSFETTTHNNVPIMWTLSEPYGAMEWWPCKQSLTDKIDSIDIYVETPLNNKVGSNGKLMYEKIDGDKKLTYWKHRYPVATYLVAIAITNYESYSHYAMVNDTDSVEILNYVYPEDRAESEYNTKFTVEVLELFSKLFIPYPFANEKYGHAQFGWGGGMEHQTMSFMGGFSENLITHELAHQWFGDHVTCGSWQHIWINEGFAVFCEYVAQEHIYPETYINWKNYRLNYVLDKTESGSVFVEDTTDINRIFNYALTYQKGGFIIQMLRNQIGDEAFFEGTKEYLNSYKTSGGFAVAEDYQQFLETAADTNLTGFFNDWYYGEGFPNYTINWDQTLNNQVHIKLSQTTTHYSVPFFALQVPILLKGADKEELVTFHNTENNQSFTYNTDFVVSEIIFDPDLNILSNHPADIVLGIKENELDNEISVMPNPANEIIKVRATKNHDFNRIDIINVSGKEVYNNSYGESQHRADINISKLPTGLYYIRINTDNGVVVKQIVKSD